MERKRDRTERENRERTERPGEPETIGEHSKPFCTSYTILLYTYADTHTPTVAPYGERDGRENNDDGERETREGGEKNPSEREIRWWI